GTWAQSIGQGWLVLTLTNSALALGAVSALQFTPMLLFGLWGGVVADRFPKRSILLVTQSCALALALIFGILNATHLITVWQIFLLAAALGAVNTVDMPTRQAFVSEMVNTQAHLGSAIALNSSLFNAARVAGPALAGLLIGWLGVTPLFFLNAASFLAVIAALARMDLPRMSRRARIGTAFAQVGEGLRYVRRTPVVFVIMTMIGLIGIFGINFQVLIPLFARDVMHRGASGYGFLMSALGLGSLAGALLLAGAGRLPRLGRVVISALLFALLQIAFVLAPTYSLSLILLAAVGFCMVFFTATANTIVQSTTPHELRGRVMSVYTTLFAGTTPIGSLIIGWLAHRYGPPTAMVVGALVSAIAAGYGVLCWWHLTHPKVSGSPTAPVASRRIALED
ncbi:MAG TPA: MFS transporter, partial [Chloroflexota bacterium]|nr:MFS transporter [Chloroflexota bacterium]